MVSFVISRVATELPQKIFHAVRLERGDRLQDFQFRLPGLCLADGFLTAGAGEPVLWLVWVVSEVRPTLVALEGWVVEPQLWGVPTPLTAAREQPGGLEVFLSLLPVEQNVGVVPAELLPSLDLARSHKGDLLGRTGGDEGVGQAGVGHQGDLGVEIAGPGTSRAHLAHTVGLQHAVHVLHISSSHPVQSQPGPDDRCDVPAPPHSVSVSASTNYLISLATSGWFRLIFQWDSNFPIVLSYRAGSSRFIIKILTTNVSAWINLSLKFQKSKYFYHWIWISNDKEAWTFLMVRCCTTERWPRMIWEWFCSGRIFGTPGRGQVRSDIPP